MAEETQEGTGEARKWWRRALTRALYSGIEPPTLISHNCWAGYVYRDLGLPYLSPFVGLFVEAPDYLALLSDFKAIMRSELRFVESSKYDHINAWRKGYPIGIIGDGIEIHFLHYHSTAEARDKWRRRSERMLWSRLFVEFCECDGCSPEHVRIFSALPFVHKVVFTRQTYPDVPCAIAFTTNADHQMRDPWRYYRRYFVLEDWLRGGDGKPLSRAALLTRPGYALRRLAHHALSR